MKSLGLLLLLSLAMNGCISMSSMQSARTHKKDNYSYTVGLGYESLKYNKKSSDSDEEKDIKDTLEEIKVPIIEVGGRYGLGENFDVGGKYNLLGTASIDGKYMFLGKGQPFAMSVGAGIGYGSLEAESSSEQDDKAKYKTTIIDVMIPLYMTFDINDLFALHFVPKYLQRSTSTTETDGSSSSDSFGVIGASAGMNFGWLFAEYSYFTSPGKSESGIQQVMIGFSGEYDKLVR